MMERADVKRFVTFGASVCVAVALVLGVVPALAANPPTVDEELLTEEVYSTRAHIAVNVNSFEGLELKWHGEYAPAEPDGEPPAASSSAWALASSGAFTPANPNDSQGRISLGVVDMSGFVASQGGEEDWWRILHHLSPATPYYARFRVENPANGNKAERLFKFTTAAIAKPEIPHNIGNENIDFVVDVAGSHSASARAEIEANGAQTEYAYEYAPAESGGGAPPANSPAWTVPTGCKGVVTVAEDFAESECHLESLAPETTYYLHVKMANEKGETLATSLDGETFTTPSARPLVTAPVARDVTGSSAYLVGGLLQIRDSETHWRFEYATSSGGPWSDVPGAEGTVSQAEAEALGENNGAPAIEARLSGLSAARTYYVRLFAENAAGEAIVCDERRCEPLSTATGNGRGFASFRTWGPPSASTLALHTLRGETLRILGTVAPGSVPTSAEQLVSVEGSPTGGSFALTFQGNTTAAIPFDASADAVRSALQVLPGAPEVTVTGRDGGPYTLFFGGRGLSGVAQPSVEGSGSGLVPSGSVGVVTTQPGGEVFDAHYHFEYESQHDFEAGGGQAFAHATSTPAVDLAAGGGGDVGVDLPALAAGETYRYRISATNTAPGDPVVSGEEQTLRVPVAAPAPPVGSCPNEQFRAGPAASLPDCRAYEQITPLAKGGAQEIYNYGGTISNGGAVEGTLVGEDGDHLMFGSKLVHWGAEPADGQSPYFFARTSMGWQLTAGTAQPQAGIFEYSAQVFKPDLSMFGFAANWATSPGPGAHAQRIEYEVGPVGGPYTTVASVPATQSSDNGGWAAASRDFSKLILQVEDHNLVGGKSTGTTSGSDLYEYAGGVLRQLNVDTAGKTIGACGAAVAQGLETSGFGEGTPTPRGLSSENSVSADGSNVFFYAAAPGDCPSPSELKPSQGAVEAGSLGGGQADLYVRVDGAGGASTIDIGAYRFVEADAQGKIVLLAREGERFRYDAETRSMTPAAPGETLSPRRYSFTVDDLPAWEFGTQQDLPAQVVRYDSSEHLLECVSCASSFDPEPRYETVQEIGTASGDEVFFDTPAALIASDVDGETLEAPVGPRKEFSLSSDVYEWRRDGLDGCVSLDGCLSLITSGRGGYLNILLGVAQDGHDVFFTTHESLLARDKDTSGDIYDARVDGGFPEPVHPVECEGDACSSPASAPLDATPSSLTFTGTGNALETAANPVKSKPKPKKAKPKKTKRRAKGRTKGGARGRRAGRGPGSRGSRKGPRVNGRGK